MSIYNKNKELEISGISFGATSGVITTLGIIMGLSTAQSSKTAIATSVLILALCDSMSDALGVRMSEESRVGENNNSVLLASVFTFIGKLLFSAIFLLPLLLLDLNQATYASVVLGFLVLMVFSILIAKRRKISPKTELFENIFMAAIVLVVSFFLGKFADGI